MPDFISREFLSERWPSCSTCSIRATARGADNYEIQVYSSEATPANSTMVEIHSNFTVDGSKQVINGVVPTNHASTKLWR